MCLFLPEAGRRVEKASYSGWANADGYCVSSGFLSFIYRQRRTALGPGGLREPGTEPFN
jgi:hypothetical protein